MAIIYLIGASSDEQLLYVAHNIKNTFAQLNCLAIPSWYLHSFFIFPIEPFSWNILFLV